MQGGDEHSGSDVDTSTASDESGSHAWTVVTSPSARAESPRPRAEAAAKAEAAGRLLQSQGLSTWPGSSSNEEGQVCSPHAREAAAPVETVADEQSPGVLCLLPHPVRGSAFPVCRNLSMLPLVVQTSACGRR